MTKLEAILYIYIKLNYKSNRNGWIRIKSTPFLTRLLRLLGYSFTESSKTFIAFDYDHDIDCFDDVLLTTSDEVNKIVCDTLINHSSAVYLDAETDELVLSIMFQRINYNLRFTINNGRRVVQFMGPSILSSS